MGKKIINDLLVSSYNKNKNTNGDQCPMNPENKVKIQNMPINDPCSINGKKPSNNNEGKKGSNQTNDNQQVQNQRNQTFVRGFDQPYKPQEQNENDENQIDEQMQEQDDNKSKVSKKENDYLKFYKFYYVKNRKEHPSWTPSQITTIVSLLWKKKKAHDKRPSAQGSCNATSRKSNKPLTGKDAFKLTHKNFSKTQVDEMWSKLPKQSKNFWKREGDSYGNTARLSQISSVKNSKAPLPIYNAMKLLLNKI